MFAHSDNKGLFKNETVEILYSLKEVIFNLFELHRDLLIALADDQYKKTMAASQPDINKYLIQSKNKAFLLEDLFKKHTQSYQFT